MPNMQITNEARAETLAADHAEVGHDTAQPYCPACQNATLRRHGCWRCARVIAVAKMRRAHLQATGKG